MTDLRNGIELAGLARGKSRNLAAALTVPLSLSGPRGRGQRWKHRRLHAAGDGQLLSNGMSAPGQAKDLVISEISRI